MTGISKIGPGLFSGLDPPQGPAKPAGGAFAAALREAVEKVSQTEDEAAAEIRRFLGGESEDLHKTLLAIQRSELAFEMLLQVRNKVVQAYQEIMRIQV